VDATNRNGTLTKAGLGSLFGAISINGGTSKPHLQDSLLFVAQAQARIGDNGGNAYSTQSIAPVIRGTGVKVMCRFNDMCPGWPYQWLGYNDWINQVTAASNQIKNNYQDVVYGIAIFNEPDAQLYGADFMNDPLVGGGTNHDARINWLWTETFRVIRSILPNVKIMGPNWFDYRPQADGAHQTRMRNFLINAINTNTVPDIMGWHSLVFGNPRDVTIALENYYRPLETSLGVPGAPLPISIEEYGINNGAFEGIPGPMVKYWAEFERAKIDFACMGIYENGGSIGNTMRYAWETPSLPNAGWHMMNWYKKMEGQKVNVTRSTFDGISTWNAAASELTVVFGGTTENSSVQINGLGTLGLGTQVRVRLDRAEWTTNQNVANTAANQGGDPQAAPISIYDRTFPLDSNGNLSVPVRLESNYDGFRIIVSPAAAPATQADKYEAELATVQNANIVAANVANKRASAMSYVGSIDFASSSVTFNVTVPSTGFYRMDVRYAAALGDATHNLTVNGTAQGAMEYPGTAGGWANNELRIVTRLVSLVQGANTISFGKGTSFAELDYIALRPDNHRYQAKLATVNNVTLGKYANMFMVPDFAGGINDPDSYVEFSVEVPVAGDYGLEVTYGNGTGGNAVNSVTVNGTVRGNITCVPTGGWLSAAGGPVSKRRKVKTVQALTAGWNTVKIQKVSGFAELDFMTVSPYVPETLAQPVWAGTVNGKWDNTTENWKDAVSGNNGIFVNPAPVVFNDTAAGVTAVTLDQAVSPASVTFNNSTKAYTLTGTGGISGSTGLLKQGSQPLTLSTANAYTGITTLSGGTTTVNNLSNGESPSSIGASPAAAANLVLNGGTLHYSGAAKTIDRGFSITAANSGIFTANNLTLSGNVTTGTGNLTKSGTGNLTLSQNGALTLGNVSPGLRVQQGAFTLQGAGAQNASVTGDLWVANTPDVSADLTVNNSSLAVSAFLALGRGNGNDGVCRFNAAGSTIQTGNFSTGYNNGLANNASEQFVALDNSTWNNSGLTYLAESTGSTSVMTLNGTARYNTAGIVILSRFAGTTSTLNLNASSVFAMTAGYTSIGREGTATLNVGGSAIYTATPNADFNVGDVSGGAGTVNLSGSGTINATQVFIGKNGGSTGTVNQTGGSFQSASFVSIGRFAGGVGTVTISGGTFSQNGVTNPLHVGELGTGTLTVSGGGTVISHGTGLLLGGGAGASGTVHLNGGTLVSKRVAEGAGGSSAFNFNGGLLKANTGASTNFMSGLDSATVKSGGAFIDTNGQSIAITQNLLDGSGGGGLTKSGSGTLLLNSTNTYTGATNVAAGILGGNGSVAGPLAVPAGGTLAPGNSVGTFTAGAAILGGSYACEIDGANADKLVVNGALVINPGAVLNFSTLSAPTAPALVIASYTSLTGIFSSQNIPSGYQVVYQYDNGITSNNIALVSLPVSPYAQWAAERISGMDPQADASPGGDPDGDGSSNLAEFALDGNPLSGTASGKVAGKLAAVDGSRAMTLTIPVRSGAAFSGTTEQVSGAISGVIYKIQASGGLDTWDRVVREVTGADKIPIEDPMPDLVPDGGWEYRTFRIEGSGQFLRAVVTPQ
ncbi:MAG: hypothetical protein EOP88_12830, partial [Verrucomicrobiaceae bacterium]